MLKNVEQRARERQRDAGPATRIEHRVLPNETSECDQKRHKQVRSGCVDVPLVTLIFARRAALYTTGSLGMVENVRGRTKTGYVE